MSGDILNPTTEKKEKKSKKSKSKENVEDAAASEAMNGSSVEKKKKKSKKDKDEVAKPAIEIDAEASVPQHGEKKKKKKKKKDAEESNAMDVDIEVAPGPSSSDDSEKKKKKRKREEGNEETASPSAESESKQDKKEKKKRRKEQAAEKSNPKSSEMPAEAAIPNTPSPSSTSVSKPTQKEVSDFLEKHNITIHNPPGKPDVTPIVKFTQLDIPSELRFAFATFKEPSPIQACTWPPAFDGSDVVGIAETGSGKTLAFGLPAMCRLIKSPIKPSKATKSTVSMLVVAPTRELAIQTHETLSMLGKPFKIASVAVFGGVPKEPQVKMLQNANKGKDGMTTRIIVGTPGRILDLMEAGACDLSGVDYLVLDEADRMLDKGFENDIRRIISNTKPAAERQTMMFSATWPEAVRRLASTFQQNPVRVTVGSDDLTANSRVEQAVEVFDDSRSKDQRLLNVLKSLSHKKTTTNGAAESRILIFALYKKEASRVEQMLGRQGYAVGAIHGDMNQNARMEALENFKNGTTGLLVATDVAARGLDIPNVGAVVNYTFPLTIEDYIHRIGRTGRGGKSGKSITFFTGDAHEKALAGEFARVLREGGFDYEGLKKFPMTIKKKEHGAYGAFYRDDIPVPKGPTKIVFD